MLPPGNGGTAPVYGHALGHVTYERHRPEHTLLDQLIEQHYPALIAQLDAQGRSLPPHVHQEFEAYLKCGRLEHGFLRVRCATYQLERLVVFSCKKRGFCPSCGARRMAETATLLSDEVFPDAPLRQWVISFPFRYGTCSLPIPRQWVRLCASFTGRSRPTCSTKPDWRP